MPPQNAADGGDQLTMVVELPLGEATATFSLEKAVCSHGLFMMAPNYWDPKSKTFQRPLRLSLNLDDPDYERSVTVKISQPCHSYQPLLQLQVLGIDSLSSQQQHSLLNQVRRMLRLSEEDNRNVRDFQEIHREAKEKDFGRVFRSPTLFEDMIKCILLCNCQWSRTLSMARALCELQWELQHPLSSKSSVTAHNVTITQSRTPKSKDFIPKTPAGKETKRMVGGQKFHMNLANTFAEADTVIVEEVPEFKIECNDVSDCCQRAEEPRADFDQLDDLQCSAVTEPYSLSMIGNFPSPKELASVDESLLAKRCNLGYRASRILKLAQLVVEGGIQLGELEEACKRPTLSSYDKLAGQLKGIDGFGPFTCANVLMCMGFYHAIPSDSETIRHLKQVHAMHSTIRTVHKNLDTIYGKYAPFQFLAYWLEVWNFYEDWFGKMSEMDPTKYKRITAANMRPQKNAQSKRIKMSTTEKNLQ
ncbi:hypothetical protein ACH5RR_001791 [Cinchona calisaya]|uniref:HhH-GPD domain-containing protein n=1 Tax=Cinchona calisaya TaxID=153742 RepID=A0ABD3B4F6_9GENT